MNNKIVGEIKFNFKVALIYLKMFIKWIILATLVGVICGLVGSMFCICLSSAVKIFNTNSYILYFLPFSGLTIVFLYKFFKQENSLWHVNCYIY